MRGWRLRSRRRAPPPPRAPPPSPRPHPLPPPLAIPPRNRRRRRRRRAASLPPRPSPRPSPRRNQSRERPRAPRMSSRACEGGSCSRRHCSARGARRSSRWFSNRGSYQSTAGTIRRRRRRRSEQGITSWSGGAGASKVPFGTAVQPRLAKGSGSGSSSLCPRAKTRAPSAESRTSPARRTAASSSAPPSSDHIKASLALWHLDFVCLTRVQNLLNEDGIAQTMSEEETFIGSHG
mmetsp:Transcript_14465/g.47529  ORF Transcript_14465/g.47529 Transcript_14465/m.47529 type:complete len:235 (+) Transcript_14465:299-1003(+)